GPAVEDSRARSTEAVGCSRARSLTRRFATAFGCVFGPRARAGAVRNGSPRSGDRSRNRSARCCGGPTPAARARTRLADGGRAAQSPERGNRLAFAVDTAVRSPDTCGARKAPAERAISRSCCDSLANGGERDTQCGLRARSRGADRDRGDELPLSG